MNSVAHGSGRSIPLNLGLQIEVRQPSSKRGRSYDVAPDGQRFLMIKEGTPAESGTPPSLILVQNWFEELRRLVPTD